MDTVYEITFVEKVPSFADMLNTRIKLCRPPRHILKIIFFTACSLVIVTRPPTYTVPFIGPIFICLYFF